MIHTILRACSGIPSALGRFIFIGMALCMIVTCSQNSAQTADKDMQNSNTLNPDNQEPSKQWTRILVQLNVPDLGRLQAQAARQKDPMTARALDQQIALRIATVADQVLEAVIPTEAKLIRRYNTLPILSLQASPRAASILTSLPEVRAIEMDQRLAPAQ